MIITNTRDSRVATATIFHQWIFPTLTEKKWFSYAKFYLEWNFTFFSLCWFGWMFRCVHAKWRAQLETWYLEIYAQNQLSTSIGEKWTSYFWGKKRTLYQKKKTERKRKRVEFTIEMNKQTDCNEKWMYFILFEWREKMTMRTIIKKTWAKKTKTKYGNCKVQVNRGSYIHIVRIICKQQQKHKQQEQKT